tara:strand:- start:101 stop:616 length:516 start_codon:yes stop_codon:yes gene_type:complete
MWWSVLSAAFTVFQGINAFNQGKAARNYYNAAASWTEFEGKTEQLKVKQNTIKSLRELKEQMASTIAMGAAGGLNTFEGVIFNNIVQLRKEYGEDLRLDVLNETLIGEKFSNMANQLRSAGKYAYKQGKSALTFSIFQAGAGLGSSGAFDNFNLFGGKSSGRKQLNVAQNV